MSNELFWDARDIAPASYATDEFKLISQALPQMQRGLFITGSGTLIVRMAGGTQQTFNIPDTGGVGVNFKGVIASILPGTTVTGIKLLIGGGCY